MKDIELIARWEGLHEVRSDGLVYPYEDLVGVPTIGYGFIDPTILAAAPLTVEGCELILEHEVARYRSGVIRLSPVLALEGNDDRLAAITSFAYNLGLGAYQRSTLRRRVNAQRWDDAKCEIRRWIYAGGKPIRGLRLRREEEASLL